MMRRDQRGSIPLLTALLAVPLIGFAGLAIDATRAWLVQSRLQTSLDAAVLVAAREVNQTTAAADATALFWANFGRASVNSTTGFLGAVTAQPTLVTLNNTTVQMSGTATVSTPFMRVLGLGPIVVQGVAAAQRASYGMELTLVLDNTGSMAGWPIQSVVSSATSLVNIVYGSGSQDTQPNLWVAVVPFTAEVNIGPSHTSWLDPNTTNLNAYLNTSWMGCVMARVQNGNDFTDATPAQAPFTPFLYLSTRGKYFVGKTPITGDNDWSSTNITEANQSNLGNATVGPNLGCSPVPVLPLTASRTTVLATISKMVAVYRGGTFINLGLQAGWWTLSPNWRGLWGNPSLPLNYNTLYMNKVLVLMTDGNNEWYDWPGGAPGVGPSPWVNDGDADFTAYGRLKQNLMGLSNNTQANATANINSRMSQMCAIIKQNGILVYTIIFNHSTVDPATVTLFQNCATTPQNFFLTPTAADLQAAFTAIGSQLANLRLTQ